MCPVICEHHRTRIRWHRKKVETIPRCNTRVCFRPLERPTKRISDNSSRQESGGLKEKGHCLFPGAALDSRRRGDAGGYLYQKSFVGIYLEIVTVPNFNRSAKISQANAQVTAAVRSYPYERVSASSSQHSALLLAASGRRSARRYPQIVGAAQTRSASWRVGSHQDQLILLIRDPSSGLG